MIITLTLNLPDLEENPEKLPRILRQLVDTLEGDSEPDVNVMDGSLNIKDTDGGIVGTLEFEWE